MVSSYLSTYLESDIDPQHRITRYYNLLKHNLGLAITKMLRQSKLHSPFILKIGAKNTIAQCEISETVLKARLKKTRKSRQSLFLHIKRLCTIKWQRERGRCSFLLPQWSDSGLNVHFIRVPQSHRRQRAEAAQEDNCMSNEKPQCDSKHYKRSKRVCCGRFLGIAVG